MSMRRWWRRGVVRYLAMAAGVLWLTAGVASAASYLPADGLIACWKADGDYTETIAARDGAPVGTTGFGSGRFDQAFDLGASGYVTVPDDDIWTFPGDFTISLWARWSQPAPFRVGRRPGGRVHRAR